MVRPRGALSHKMVAMPIPPAVVMAASAKQTFERLRRTGVSLPVKPTLPGLGLKAPLGIQQAVDYPALIDKVCAAICSAWGAWRASATLLGVTVNGPNAIGGRVAGPSIGPLITAAAMSSSPEANKLAQNVAKAIGDAFTQVAASMSVPGLPWYPMFAAYPGPMAPPTPNIPCPLAALTVNAGMVGKTVLKMAMCGLESNAPADHTSFYEAIAGAYEQAFQMWTSTSLVTNVMGSGPVPTWAAPVVPVGPVVGGTAVMMPGGFV